MILIGGIAAASKGASGSLIELFAGAPMKIVLVKALLEGMGGVFFGMLGALPVPAIIRKLQTNRLIPTTDKR